jgi:protein-S-isoprenylcysteine O-methyltransferase Ste14
MLKEDRDLLAARFEEQCQEWEKTRQRGRTLYVLFEMLRLGGLIVGWRLMLDYFTDKSRLHRDLDRYSMGGYALVFFISALFGLWEWRRNERKYCRN